MFDRATAATIRSAPRLRGVDPERLAADLTDAYVQVAVARSFLDNSPEHIDGVLLAKLLSIARAQETLALIVVDPVVRRAAASVAARAYQVIALSAAPTDLAFSSTSIPAAVSSMLLFVACDSTPDAEEMTQYLTASESSTESALSFALSSLGRADFPSVAALDLPLFELPSSAKPDEIAAYVGYYECARQLVAMCGALLLQGRGAWRPGAFASIRDRMRSSFRMGAAGDIEVDDTISGPWHLATLLDLTEKVLVESALTGVAAPTGVPDLGWSELVEHLAKRRPTLWRNHRDAVRAGFLEAGKSAVVTFPTGAGKSTVTELKIAATVLRGQNVIVLVPTLSLLDQQANAIRSTLGNVRVVAARDIEEKFEALGSGPTVFVHTPESCLASISFDATRFGDVGLIAFDEAHLLSSTRDRSSRRAIDASLCLLLLMKHHPVADIFLVSAMIENADDLRAWLADATGRSAIGLDDPWKPTRQARGAVVYRAEDVDRLNATISTAQAAANTDGAPITLKRRIEAVPYGFFGLLTTWDSTSSRDYRLLPLLEAGSPLSVNGKVSASGWRLGGNSNKTAAAIAIAGARSNKKVLVFTQQVGWAVSTARDVNVPADRRIALNAGERALLARAIEMTGTVSALYGEFVDDHVVGDALPHHGLLLREERRLHESLYKRLDGVPVLVATSTLAQGMNFPSEIVVIAGDRRFDTETDRLQRLEAQELLNAAGRAGRAGMRSNGLVVVVPSYPVSYDGAQRMGPGWFELQQAFSRADQCVEVVDPITEILLDDADSAADEILYLSRRLANPEGSETSRDLVANSFGAFQIRRAGREQELEQRLGQVALSLELGSPHWLVAAVAATGLPPEDVEHIAAALESGPPDSPELLPLKRWFAGILSERPGLVLTTLRAGSRAVFKGAPVELGSEWPLDRSSLASTVDEFLDAWMGGRNLSELQQLGLDRRLCKENENLEFARKFVLRVVPDLAYLYSLPWLVARLRGSDVSAEGSPLSRLAAAIEAGVDTLQKLDHIQESVMRTRASAHRSVT